MSRMSLDPTELGATKLNNNDKFRFKCTGCGNCCRGRSNIIKETNIFLSGPDIKRISEYLNMTKQEVFEKHIVKVKDSDLGLDMCAIKIKATGVCTFLKNGICSIYEARPRTCGLYPLGRAIKFCETHGKMEYCQTEYTINADEPGYKCTADNQYTIAEWLERNNIPEEDIEDIKWYGLICDIMLQRKKENLSDEECFAKLYL